MFQQLRTQLIASFLMFSGLNISIIAIAIHHLNFKEEAEQIKHTIDDVQLLALTDFKIINDFFTYETKDSNFFIHNDSEYLNRHNFLQHNLYSKLKEIEVSYQNTHGHGAIDFKPVIRYSTELNAAFDTITKLIVERGFKDFGTEGEMRYYAHQLENNHTIKLDELLMLRRHEKDYIIRNEQKYIDKFNTRIDKIINEFIAVDSAYHKRTIELLKMYRDKFNYMVMLDKAIGIKNNTGLKARMEYNLNELVNAAGEINALYGEQINTQMNRLRRIAILEVLLVLVLGLYLSLKLSKLVTRRISLLSQYLSKYISSCFTYVEKIPVKTKADEIGLLINHFELMREKISEQLNFLEVKVAERTEEINTQKEQIQKQNNKLTDSLRYALRIQEALLPEPDFIAETWDDHFVFFQPKDMVSGDFYWYKRINNEKFNISVFAVADCTGHGVPGAFMSMLGIAFLNDVVLKKEVCTSADMLNSLRDKVLETLAHQQSDKSLSDGMDIGLVLVDHDKSMLQFSGALRFMYIIREGDLIKLDGDRMPIGKYINQTVPFSFKEFQLHKNDMFYLFTDGFADQIGGNRSRKYLRKNLRSLLISSCHLPCYVQHDFIRRNFLNWKNGNEQTDDVLLAGFRFNS